MSINIDGDLLSSSGYTYNSEINDPNVITDGLVVWYDVGNFSSYAGDNTDYYNCGYGCQYYSSDPGCESCDNMVLDMSGYGMDARMQSTVTASYSQIGGELNFAGTTGSYMVAGNLDANDSYRCADEITIMAWVNPSAAANGNIVSYNFNPGYRCRIATTTREIWFYVNGNNISGGAIPLDKWSHITCTGDADGLAVYLDTELGASNAVAYAPVMADYHLLTGSFNSTSEFWDGRMAVIMIYNRALSHKEIVQTYNAGLPRFADTELVIPTPTTSTTPTQTPSITPTRTPSITPTRTPSRTPSLTPSLTPTRTPSRTPTITPTRSPIPTPSASPAPRPDEEACWAFEYDTSIYWRLDSSGNHNSITSSQWIGVGTAGVIGDCVYCGGTDAYMAGGDGLSHLTSQSISGWVHLESGDSPPYYIFSTKGSTGGGVAVHCTATSITFEVLRGSTSYTYSVNHTMYAAWVHFVVTHNASTRQTIFYMDGGTGQSGYVPSYGAIAATGTKIFVLCNDINLSTDTFHGDLDEMKVFNKVLTAGEASLYYNGGSGLACDSVPDGTFEIDAAYNFNFTNVTGTGLPSWSFPVNNGTSDTKTFTTISSQTLTVTITGTGIGPGTCLRLLVNSAVYDTVTPMTSAGTYYIDMPDVQTSDTVVLGVGSGC